MPTDKSEAKIAKLMEQPEKIRNIAIAAHIDHGKCVAGDSRIILEDGRVMDAEKLFNFSEDKGRKAFDEKGTLIYDVSKLNLKVFSLNKNDKKLECRQISHAWKLNGGDVIKLSLRNGFEIKTTPEHKYIVFENFEFKEKEARELKIGDRVVCSRNINIKNEFRIKEFILNSLAKENFYVFLKEEFGRKIKNALLSDSNKFKGKVGSGIKNKSFYHGSWQSRYRIKDMIEISKVLGIDFEFLYNNIESVCYRKGTRRGKSSLKINLPQNFEDLFYIAGLMFGDGHEKKFIVGKPELEKIFARICNEMGIKISFREYDRTREVVTNETFSRMLNCLFGYPLKRKSHNIKIGEILWKSDENCAASFIRGYFDTDGCVEKSRKAISVSSASSEMLRGLSLLLLRFGCVSNWQGKNLFISGYSAKKFKEEIGFNVKAKAERLNDLIKTMKGSYVCDLISINQNSGKVVSQSGKGLLCLEKEKKILLINLLQEFAFIEIKKLERDFEEIVYDFSVPENKNFVAEGMIIHNTTFSDNLLAGAGMMNEELAGKQLAMDFHEDEQARGITIDAANVSMVHNVEGKDYLINLIDTPGHVDFGGDVTRAMRAVDGAIVLCCASEGIMPQTETVLRQALKERVKPVLFINKVDRLIREVKLTPEQMQERFIGIIHKVNELIKKIAEKEYGLKWQVNVKDGSVAFGSAYHNWALSVPYMQKKGMTFKDIIDAYEKGDEDWKKLSKKAPLHEVVLDMTIHHHPSPKDAQVYRIPKIWHGDLDSGIGKDLVACDDDGAVAFICTKVVIDKNAGEIAAGRLFSGTLRQGDPVYMNLAKKNVNLQQVSVYKGARRIQMEKVTAGNIVGLVGLKGVFSGETVSGEPMEPFEAIKHLFEPVVTKSIEATKAADLPKLVEILRQVGKEDPSIKIEINEETGENLISGMGELHLEVIENRIKSEKGLPVKTGAPIIVYRETVTKASDPIQSRTPNGHNIFFFSIEPLEEDIYQAIENSEVPEERMKKRAEATWAKLSELGMSNDEARQVKEIYKGNIFEDRTRGLVLLGDIIDSIMDGWRLLVDAGPLSKEPLMKTKFILWDAKIHVDHMHRGPAQIYPAVRHAMQDLMGKAGAAMLEPIQTHQVEAPVEFMGAVTSLISSKRGELLDVQQDEAGVVIKAKIPVAEMIGWSNDLRSATEGRGISSLIDQAFQRAPRDTQENIIKKIRARKGLAENQ